MMFNASRTKQSAMVDQQVVDKENVPPQARLNMTTQRPTKTNRVLVINPRSKWPNESLEIAMDVVECDIIFLRGGQQVLGRTMNFIF
jgi:hypothetical protein